MATAKQPKVPDRVQRLVNFCKAGRTLCLSIRHSEVGDEKVYWLEPGGKACWRVDSEASPRNGAYRAIWRQPFSRHGQPDLQGSHG